MNFDKGKSVHTTIASYHFHTIFLCALETCKYNIHLNCRTSLWILALSMLTFNWTPQEIFFVNLPSDSKVNKYLSHTQHIKTLIKFWDSVNVQNFFFLTYNSNYFNFFDKKFICCTILWFTFSFTFGLK